MLSVTIRFYITAGGITAIIALIVHMSYQLGGIMTTFRKHVKDSEKAYEDQEKRLRVLERRRK